LTAEDNVAGGLQLVLSKNYFVLGFPCVLLLCVGRQQRSVTAHTSSLSYSSIDVISFCSINCGFSSCFHFYSFTLHSREPFCHSTPPVSTGPQVCFNLQRYILSWPTSQDCQILTLLPVNIFFYPQCGDSRFIRTGFCSSDRRQFFGPLSCVPGVNSPIITGGPKLSCRVTSWSQVTDLRGSQTSYLSQWVAILLIL